MSTPAEIFPPGEFLKEELEARNWSQTEFAEIIGRPVRLINEIIAAKKAITPQTATQLAASLGTSAELWMNLETQYQLSKVCTRDASIERKAKLHSKFPVRELVKRGWIDRTKDIDTLERQVIKFYQLKSLDDTPLLTHAAKKSSEDVTILQWTWLFRARQIATTQVVKKYRPAALIAAIERLRTLLSAPEELRKVPAILNEAGVRFVLLEALPGSKIDGACLWLTADQPVIALSARLDRIDNFWFVLRHEIEHLLREHGKDAQMMLDENLCDSDAPSVAVEEKLANAAASQFAVPDGELSDYMTRVKPYYFSEDRVVGFAGRLGVHPGLVIGRLHKQLENTGYPTPYKFLRAHLVKIRHILMQSAPTDGWGTVYPSK